MSTRKKKRGKVKQKVDTVKLPEMAARSYLMPSQIAANAIQDLNREVEITCEDGSVQGLDFNSLVEELKKANRAVFQGDLRRVEAILLDQSHVLESLFTFFTQKMAHAEYLSNLETYSRIALKAQNQCRQTLATLVELKNPKRATFIKQQNNAVNQQINQRRENLKNSDESANKLLKEIPSEQLDTQAPEAASRANQDLEAMGEVNRAEDGDG
jgi:hypothetical protein